MALLITTNKLNAAQDFAAAPMAAAAAGGDTVDRYATFIAVLIGATATTITWTGTGGAPVVLGPFTSKSIIIGCNKSPDVGGGTLTYTSVVAVTVGAFCSV